MLRRLLLNIHIYSGLLCFSYLLLFGISTLVFNHPYQFTRTPSSVQTWTQPLPLPPLARSDPSNTNDTLQMIRQNNQLILEALGSFAMPFNLADGQWTDTDTYHAHLRRPGKDYQIDVHPSQNSATITQSRMSFWMMTTALHGGYARFPESLLASSWAWYTELCTFVVIVGVVSGIYLWPARVKERRIGIVMLGVASVLSFALILFVTFHG